MQVAELQEVVIRLYNIREAEKELNSCFQEQSVGSPKPAAKQLKTFPNNTHTIGRGHIIHENGSLQWQGPAGERDSLEA